MGDEKTAEGGVAAATPETAKEKPSKLKAVVMAPVEQPPVDLSKPQRYRVWAHGELRHDGQVFAPGTVLELLPDQRKALKLEDVLEPA